MTKAKVFSLDAQQELGLPSRANPMHDLSEIDSTLLPSSPSESFYNKGARALLQGDKVGLRYFDLALRLAPYDASLYFEQGLCLLEYGSEHLDKSMLLLALRRLKHSLVLTPNNVNASMAQIDTLYQLGILLSDQSFFHQAEQICKTITPSMLSEDLKPEFYNQLGLCLLELAKKSGEPADYFQAATSFESAVEEADPVEINIWENLIQCYFKLFTLSSDATLLAKTIQFCQTTLIAYPSSDRAYYFLAMSIGKQYQISHNEDHIEHASRFFLKSLHINPLSPEVYVEAISLQLAAYSIDKNASHLTQVFTLYEKALHHLDNDHPSLMAMFAQAQALMGLEKEDLLMIKKAQICVHEGIENGSPDSFIHSAKALGVCCFAQGHYFQDPDFFYQAIEHFQTALSINRSRQDLWHLMAQSYSAAFELTFDEIDFNNGVKFYKKSLYFSTSSSLLFEYGYLLLNCFEAFQEEALLGEACICFSNALHRQNNAKYVHPNWLFQYAKALDLTSDFDESEENLVLSIKLLKDVYALDSNFPKLFHQLALSIHHLGTIILDQKLIQSSLHYFKLGHLKDKENDQLLLDWGSALMSYVEISSDFNDHTPYIDQAYENITRAAELGNTQSYYLLACLYAYKMNLEGSLFYLKKAHQFEVLPSIEDLEEEAFLEPLLKTEAFHYFLDQISWKNAE
ncbi:hypothetical protein COB21_00310 [Candidatus Aerophobetes bacterium]|uniref:Tetratricopeptide repeat protein n=1 Tax=Aerophobetes bacterium TaxID=2030807 RepID=A0A2A4X7Q3_UNCAE|nr:MAG: hypothetical protein COB21_00310 [Candidatus Aerophobetes bacterium]